MRTKGKTIIKGNTLKGRSDVKFAQILMKDIINHLLDGNKSKVADEYFWWKTLIETYSIEPEMIASRSSLNSTLDEYQNKVESGNNRSAAYELALNSGRKYQKGDYIVFYTTDPGWEECTCRRNVFAFLDGDYVRVTKVDSKLKLFETETGYYSQEGVQFYKRRKLVQFESVKELEHYENDYDKEYYLEALEKTVKRFLTVFSNEDYQNLFGITLKKRDINKRSKLYNEESEGDEQDDASETSDAPA